MKLPRLAIILGLFATGLASAQQNSVTLTLQQCRQMALEQNLDFRSSRYAPMIHEAGLSNALSAFDPTLWANMSGSQSQSPDRFIEGVDPADTTKSIQIPVSVPRQDIVSSTIGISKKFTFGPDVQLRASNYWNRRGPTSLANTFIRLSISQPLLNGFGRQITKMGITLARNSLDQSISELQASAISTVQSVEVAY